MAADVARQMVEAHAARPRGAPAPELVPDMSRVYPGTSVEPEHLKRLIDEQDIVHWIEAQFTDLLALTTGGSL